MLLVRARVAGVPCVHYDRKKKGGGSCLSSIPLTGYYPQVVVLVITYGCVVLMSLYLCCLGEEQLLVSVASLPVHAGSLGRLGHRFQSL